jgi:hypothetical protein
MSAGPVGRRWCPELTHGLSTETTVAEPAPRCPSLTIEGWGVASLDLERTWTSYGDSIPDRVFLFRSTGCWSLLVLRLTDRDEPKGRVARANVSLRRFDSTNELQGHVDQAYTAGSWFELAEAGRHEPELFVPWLSERVARDFDRASVVDNDLAFCVGPSGAPQPGPGRRSMDWRQRAINAVSIRLAELGFEVVAQSESNQAAVPAPEGEVGEVLVRRHGYETRGVVRVDSFGEIFVRLHDEANFTPVEKEGS